MTEDSPLDEGALRKKTNRGSVVEIFLERSEGVVVVVESSKMVSVLRSIFLVIELVFV